MSDYRRYAVYWAPKRGSALARFGTEWLGWDAEEGMARPHPEVPGLPAPAEVLTRAPRRYGFHATLKAPFRLRDGQSAETLAGAVAALAAAQAPFHLPELEIAALGPFLALVPSASCPPLDRLAAACVTELDGFRAPMEPDERERRAAGLGTVERAMLDRWGYPFVLDRFRFHLTLTGPLDDETRGQTAAALLPVLTPILARGQRISEICLFGEPETGPFRLLLRFPLGQMAVNWSG